MKNKYLVALAVGGLMEMPEFTYQDKQEIEATNPKEAEEIYNRVNNCSYFYAKCLGIVVERDGTKFLEVPYKGVD